MSTPMDVDEVPPAMQQAAPEDNAETSKGKGKAKDVGDKKRFEVKKVYNIARLVKTSVSI